jgi:hypothetical protein
MRSAVTAALLIASTLPALAAGAGAVLVIPGKAGVPVPIDGMDASYAVVEGDWGLAKNVRVEPHVIGGHPLPPPPEVGHYFPSTGQMPGYGRLEITAPDRHRLPREAESYYHSWSAQSAPPPPEPPQNPPAIIVAPQINGAPGAPPSRGH